MNNKAKIIFTDLDRSLLNNDSQISEFTKNVLLECKEKGIYIVFATARPLRGVKIFYNSIVPHAEICHLGAVAYVNNVEIYKCGINPIMVKEILENIMKMYPKANLAIESNDVMYSTHDISKIWADVYRILDIQNLPENEIDKIIIREMEIEKIKEIGKNIPKELYLEICEGKLGLIMNKGATKWNGIKKILEYYKISVKNSIAFGDDYNDIEMIENCGIGIAMENGIE